MRRLLTIMALAGLGLTGCSKAGPDTDAPQPQNIYLQKIEVVRMPLTNSSGQSWDNDGSGPDLKMVYGPAGNLNTVTDVVYNATAEELPLSLDLTFKEVQLSKQKWNFRLMDDDNVGDAFSGEEMHTFQCDFASPGSNPVLLEDGPYSIRLYFVRR
jgi:hypothetical protein